MRALAVTLFVATSALAQTAAVDSTDPSRGTTLLPGSTAFSDEATSLIYNPAGLGHSGTMNGWYFHERSNTRRQNSDSVFLSTSLLDVFGIGVGAEWLRPDAGGNRYRGLFGLSFGTETVSAGATFSWFSDSVAKTTSVDLGVQARPLRWLSLGATVRNLTQPQAATIFDALVTYPREWTLGIGLRPLGERVSIGVDWVVPESAAIAKSRLQYTINATLVRGLRVQGGISHTFTAGQPLYVQLGLGVDLENFGYTQGFSFAGNDTNYLFAARVSGDKHGSIIPKSKIAVLSLADIGGTTGGTIGALLGIGGEDRYLRFARFLERAAYDPELDGVVLKVEGAGIGLARSDEIRSAIIKLRAAGKKVYAYVLSAADADYLMISACDGIYAAPEAMMIVDGLRSSVMYFGGTAKMLGVQVDVARVGKYKSFPDQFTRLDMSDEQRETISAYLDTAVKTIAARVLESRKIDGEKWQAALDEGLKSTRREKELGTIDGVMTPTQFDEFLRAQLPNARVDQNYRPFDWRDTRWGVQQKIAIIPVLGNITGGKNQASPLGGELIAGAQTFIEQITAAANDVNVAAIVVRVDSGGGDGLASDLMYRAVLEAKKRKPVIASMGDVAASGGYYVSMGADRVFASPTTLTGSIGVFFAKPAIRDFAEKFGTSQVNIQRGKLAGITDYFDPWSDGQREAAQKWVDDFYDSFITEAATSRKTTKEAIDAVARGHVWSGEDALAHNLVDQLGGLLDAVAYAKKQAGITGNDVSISIMQGNDSFLGSLVGATAPKALLELELPRATLPPVLEALAKQLGPTAWLLEPSPRIQARMEWLVEIK